MDNLLQLKAFRQDLYAGLGKARDALFELMDAVLTTPPIRSFAELSLAPAFRRRWPSLYEALQDGSPDAEWLLRLALRFEPASVLERALLIGDHTAWPRCSAPTLRERTYEHHPTRAQCIAEGEPITRGFGYATLALLPGQAQGSAGALPGSWVTPLLHERITPKRSPLECGADELARVCRALEDFGGGVPTSLWDAEYGCGPFLRLTEGIRCNKVLRLRPNRYLYAAAPPYSGHGRPFEHGPVFKPGDETTWPLPERIAFFHDAAWGWMHLRAWRGLHLRKSPGVSMTVVCAERVSGAGTKRKPALMWLAWVGVPGEAEPKPEQIWRLYLRRFSVEHFYRFAKQRLCWTLPRFSTPEQSDRWSRLLVPVMTELHLARGAVGDHHLPWQKAQAEEAMTPGRVLSGMGGIIAAIGTEARVPKRRGKSPGWPTGRVRRRRDRYPVVRKKKKRPARGQRQAV